MMYETVLVYFKIVSQHIHAGITEKNLLDQHPHRLDGRSVRERGI